MSDIKTVKLSVPVIHAMQDLKCMMLVCTRSWRSLRGCIGDERMIPTNKTSEVFTLLRRHNIDLKCDVYAIYDPLADVSVSLLLELTGTVAVIMLGKTKKDSHCYLNYSNLAGYFPEEIIQHKGESLMVVYVTADYPEDQRILVADLPAFLTEEYSSVDKRRRRVNKFLRQVSYELEQAHNEIEPYKAPEGMTLFGNYSQIKYLKTKRGS